MRVYIAGTRPAGIMELTARFGDSGVGAENCCAAGGAERMLLRLALLESCDAIYLSPGWADDPRARVEKAFADYLRIPRVEYCLP